MDAVDTAQSRMVQVEPINPRLKASGTTHLKLQYDEPPSNIAFRFNFRRYTLGVERDDWLQASSVVKHDSSAQRVLTTPELHGQVDGLKLRACDLAEVQRLREMLLPLEDKGELGIQRIAVVAPEGEEDLEGRGRSVALEAGAYTRSLFSSP